MKLVDVARGPGNTRDSCIYIHRELDRRNEAVLKEELVFCPLLGLRFILVALISRLTLVFDHIRFDNFIFNETDLSFEYV
jgi:hypothetical protein